MNLRLYEPIPNGVTVDGVFYPCDFDFRNVLKMLDVMQREDVYPDARDFLCVKCIVHKRRIRNASAVFRAICDLLFEKTPDSGGARVTSFEQDAGMIRAAFMQVYGIDLFHAKLTWFEFTDYLHNIPEGNKYSDVLGIRARPIPPANKYNQKEREWLLDAKKRYALHLTEAEAARKYEADVTRIFNGLMSMIPKDAKEVNGQNGE